MAASTPIHARQQTVEKISPVELPKCGTVVNFDVFTIANYLEIIEKGSFIHDDQIFSITEYTTTIDGYVNERVPVIRGHGYNMDGTHLGQFEIRPASGLVITIDTKKNRLATAIQRASDNIMIYSNGGSRKEWWNIPLRYGSKARILDWTEDEDGDMEHNHFWVEYTDVTYKDICSVMGNEFIVSFPEYEDDIHWKKSIGMIFRPTDINGIQSIQPIAKRLEKLFIAEERRNENRCEVYYN